MEYTITLALEDYLPVILSGIALSLLAHMIWQMDRQLGRMAFVGVALAMAGGLFKASWKLIIASTGVDVTWMSQLLFPLVGPGFTCFAWSLYQVRRAMREQPPLRRPWLAPVLIIAAFAGLALYVASRGGPWRLVMLALTTLANTSILALLIVASWRRGMWLTGVMFLANLLIIFMLSGMAQLPRQTIALQWIEQLIQTFSQALFALAAWRYGRRIAGEYRQTMVARPAMA